MQCISLILSQLIRTHLGDGISLKHPQNLLFTPLRSASKTFMKGAILFDWYTAMATVGHNNSSVWDRARP